MSDTETSPGFEPQESPTSLEQGVKKQQFELLSTAVAKLSPEEANALSELIADAKARALSDQEAVDRTVKDAQDKGRREAFGMKEEEQIDLNLAVDYLHSISADQLLNNPVFSWRDIQVLAQIQRKMQEAFA